MKLLMKRSSSILMAACMMASLVPAHAFAAESLTVTNTGIRADAVGNYEGYGSVSLFGDMGDQHGLINRDGSFIFPYTEGDYRYSVYDNVVSYGLLGYDAVVDWEWVCAHEPAYYDLNGNRLFQTITLPEGTAIPQNSQGNQPVLTYASTPMVGGYAVVRLNYGAPYIFGEYQDDEWSDPYPDSIEVFIDKTGNATCITGNLGDGFDSHTFVGFDFGWFGDNGWVAYAARGVNLVVGYLDSNGQEVLNMTDASVMNAWFFHDGFSVVQMYDDEKYGVIDTSGNFVIPCIYEELVTCSDEMFAAKQNGKWGYIDRTGQVVIPFLYDATCGWSDGLGAVAQNGKYGLVDRNNTIVLSLEYDDISDFTNGVCYAIKDGNLYIITR